MTDRVQLQVTGPVAVIPTPSCIRPRPAADDQACVRVTPALPARGEPGSRRTAAREVLEKALRGVRLSSRDRQFLARLVHWDKRNASSVAALLNRAREAGREEAGLTPRQREVIIAALRDAAIYRASGAAGLGCWDCEMIPGGRCAEHARDNDRADTYSELAAMLAGTAVQPGLAEPSDIAGYRRRTPVAS
ncbi:MAG TPA: hypothetical protein VGG35_04545 [Streptosporangiaceae bacterium]|jgi:hypothetical protein